MLNQYELLHRETAIQNAWKNSSAPILNEIAPDLERPALTRSYVVDLSFVKEAEDSEYNGDKKLKLPVWNFGLEKKDELSSRDVWSFF